MPVNGTTGDDVIAGTPGADVVHDAWGDDVIDTGEGDDVIADSGGNNSIRAGGGNDIIRLTDRGAGSTAYEAVRWVNFVDAGAGDDDVRVSLARAGELRIDLGTGNDRFVLSSFLLTGSEIEVATGAGSDRVVLDQSYGDRLRLTLDSRAILISDFAAGSGGDILDIGGLLSGLLAYEDVAANPFASGHLLLIQDGTDTIVRIDIDGFGPGSSDAYLRDVARLSDVSVASMTAFNLSGYDPNGAAPLRSTITGSSAGEMLSASNGGANISGLGGHDRIFGGVGHDLLDGGADSDQIDGGLGDDIIRGGDGDDILSDAFGNDIFEAGAGNDTISIFRPALPEGLPFLSEAVSIDAGDGDDFVRFEMGRRPFGQFTTREVALTIDLGSGDDHMELPYLIPGTRLTLGAGADRVALGQLYLAVSSSGTPLAISDFAAGAGGDVLELDRAITVGAGWNGTSNPFATGHLRLQQSGADTLVLFDYDGNASGTEIHTLVRLSNVAASSLTAFNFGGYAPNGSPSFYTVGGGTAGNDILFGSNASDTINGGAGNDRIEERKSGSDTLIGGDGQDVIIVARTYTWGADTITIDAGADDDQVDFTNYSGRLIVDLGPGNDRLELRAAVEGGSVITLGTGADVVVLDGNVASQILGAITINDFATGAGGDRFDWNMFAELELINDHWRYSPAFSVADYNPFLTEDARLVQSGADTLLQINTFAGSAMAPSYVTLVTFRSANVANFTAFNIGYATYTPTVQGDSGNDILPGSGGDDILSGGGGDDRLEGLGGNDVLRGGDGADVLIAGAGNDHLAGGAGGDTLNGGDDSDWLDGGSGRDRIDGGAGDDAILDLYGLDAIQGGAGNDRIDVWAYYDAGVGGGTASGGSIFAGEGNDDVDLHNNLGLDNYTVDLGAGDDLLRIERPIFSLTLGPGRDTVVYATAASRNRGDFVLTDFATGDSGDIFDLKSYLAGALTFSQGAILVGQLGYNPFALGYVELRQVGNHVELRVYPDGLNDDAIYVQTPVRFLNTTVAQFTAANFGGYDPTVPPNRATIVDQDLTIAAGAVVTTLNATPIMIPGPISTGFAFRAPGGGTPDFVNYGSVTVGADAAGFAGGLAGVYVYPGWVSGGSFVNAAGADFSVRNDFVDEVGYVAFQSQTYGFYAPSQSVSFRNDGRFEVSTTIGQAIGVLAGFDGFNRYPVINNSTFFVDSGYDAIGFDLGETAQFINTGSVMVTAAEIAIGAYFRNYANSQFSNQGAIDVISSPSSPYNSIGILANLYEGNAREFANGGSIAADIAIYLNFLPGSGGVTTTRFDNSGQITGAIYFGTSDGALINRGVISGPVFLEGGNDTYDGRNGTLNGYVLGGTGNDVLYGGDGIDDLEGSEGDDWLAGGLGADYLTGSSGSDTASYFDSTAAVTVSLISGRGTGGSAEGDFLFEIENVAGGTFNDTLIGNDAANRIDGGEGGDVILGLGGNDTLIGGPGAANTLQGGIGDDSYFVFASGDSIVEFAGEGIDQIYADLPGLVLAANVENLIHIGIGAFRGTGNALANVLAGGDGDDVLDGLEGSDTLLGRGGNDILIGGYGTANTLQGGAGNDSYYLSVAGDSVVEFAAEGIDRVYTDLALHALAVNVEYLIYVGTGAFTGIGNASDNVLAGAIGNDTLNGQEGADILVGREGNDVLIGGAGAANTLQGGSGDDNYYVSAAGDTVFEFADEGIDTVRTTLAQFTLSNPNIENLIFIGGGGFTGIGNAAANLISGGAGDDLLNGQEGADILLGASGNDVLIGGAGKANTLQGGVGNDAYYVSAAGDSVYEAASEGTDIVYSDLAVYVLPDAIENLAYTGNGTFTGVGNAVANTILGGNGDDLLNGLDGDDSLIGGGGADRLIGGAGSDLLNGAAGGDVLEGGAGADYYLFDTALRDGNVDVILGFIVGSDRVLLDDNIFTALPAGALATGAFALGAAALEADDHILYDAADGALYYDADGAGGVAAIQFANIGSGLSLSALDFGIL